MIKTILAALGIVAAPSGAAEHVSWPNLPKTGFVAGRPAAVEDVKAGNAVFSTNGTGGSAASMTIPQYVYWSDEYGTKHPKFLIQAEKTPDGATIVGLRDFAGHDTVATLPEIELLGMKKPN